MSTTLPQLAAPVVESPFELAVRVLRDRRGLTAAIVSGREHRSLITALTAIAAVGAAVFGLAVGLQGGLLQALSSAVKLPLVLLGAAGISLPLLHVGCALAGRRLHPTQLSALVLQALATAAVTMAGLAPLVVVVWLSLGALTPQDLGMSCVMGDCHAQWYAYRRVVLATVGVAAMGGLAGATRLIGVLPMRALLPWTAAFGLAGVQLSWLLRPLVGTPEGPTVLFRAVEANGLQKIVEALLAVMS